MSCRIMEGEGHQGYMNTMDLLNAAAAAAAAQDHLGL